MRKAQCRRPNQANPVSDRAARGRSRVIGPDTSILGAQRATTAIEIFSDQQSPLELESSPPRLPCSKQGCGDGERVGADASPVMKRAGAIVQLSRVAISAGLMQRR